ITMQRGRARGGGECRRPALMRAAPAPGVPAANRSPPDWRRGSHARQRSDRAALKLPIHSHDYVMKHVSAVGSGKGGVGKSTVSLNLALALVERGFAVGLLDADLYRPNIPLMVGLTKHKWTETWTLARPKESRVRHRPVERHVLT